MISRGIMLPVLVFCTATVAGIQYSLSLRSILKDLPFPPILVRSIYGEILQTLDDDGFVSVPQFKVQVTESSSGEVLGVKSLMHPHKREDANKLIPVICDELKVLAKNRQTEFYGPLLKACREREVNTVILLLRGTLPSPTYTLMVWKKILKSAEGIEFICLDPSYDLLVRLMDPPIALSSQAYLGSGSYGEVTKGTWEHVGEVAIKKIELDEFTAKTVILEIMAGRKVFGDPHFVKLYRAEIRDYHTVILTMELLKGHEGDYYSKKKPIQDLRILAAIVKQVLIGLHTLHEHGYLHNDIKDENIFITDDGQVKILDLGLATRINRPFKRGDWKAGIAGLAGPELYNRKVDYTPASDIWTVGTLIFSLHSNAMMKLPKRGASLPTDFETDLSDEIEGVLDRHFEGEEVKDFLRSIFIYDPSDRATIPELLAHSFIRNAATVEELRQWLALGLKK